MPRRREVPKRKITPDPKYKDKLVAKMTPIVTAEWLRERKRLLTIYLDLALELRIAKLLEPTWHELSTEIAEMLVGRRGVLNHLHR